MKTRLLRSCLTALIMLVTTASYAYDAYIDGIYYRFIGSYATVTYLDKTYSGNEFAYTGDIVIPNSVSYNGNTYNVIGIDEYAFNYCKYLTNVTIPASVKNIGRAAFSGCSNLSTVSIPEGVKSIPIEAFRSCSNLTSITIPESVTSIATFAFYSCYNLKEARFASIESLCRIAFADGSANPLGQAHHLYIGDNDDEITEITIPNSCSSIGAYTFHGCSGITSITIPEGITNIGSHAFDQCSGLTRITIPQSVTNIGTAAFYGCI